MIQRKQPSEDLVYEYDFGTELGGHEIVEIVSITSLARFGDSQLTEADRVKTPTTVRVKWAGGAAHEEYRTTVRVSDTAGQKHEIDGIIEVREQPFGGLVTVEEVKAALRLDDSEEDVLIEGYIAAAIDNIDGPRGWLGRAITRQTITHRLSGFGCGSIRLPYPPFIEMESVKYLDGSEVEQTVDPGAYYVDDGRLYPAYGVRWPPCLWRPGSVRLTYTAGYDKLPAGLHQAIIMMVHDLYRNRGSVVIGASAVATPTSTTVANLLAPYRVFS